MDPSAACAQLAGHSPNAVISLRPGTDRRVKELRLTATGKARFAAAMPYWEHAQREASRLMSLDAVSALGAQVRRAMREPA